MSIRMRSVLSLLLATLVSAALAACGGEESATGDPASASTNVDQLLKETFAGDKQVDSGRVALALKVDAKGTEGLDGPIALTLAGPFASQGDGRLPKFKLDASFTGAGQDVKAGVTSTGDKAFVAFNGADYAVSDQLFKQFEAGYEQAQKEADKEAGGKQPSLATLGIDPSAWLTDAKNAGESKVGDTDTIRITGGVDVPKLLDDVNRAIAKASSLGLQSTGRAPEQLTAEQKRQVAEAVKNPRVELHTGAQDKILRRMVVAMDVVAPAGSTDDLDSAAIRLDLSLTEVNADQKITAPADTKPLDDLLEQFGGLGALGGGLGSGSSGSGSADQAQLKRYTDCIGAAGSDTAAAQKCAELLKQP